MRASSGILALSLGILLLLSSCPASSPEPPARAPASTSLDAAQVEQGRRLFTRKACDYCHSLDGSPATGPSLVGIARRSDRSTLIDWSMDPEVVYQREGRRPLHRGFAPMPRQEVTRQEAEALAEYLLSLIPPSGQ
jgi:mono/diheme cytochrome c family protein